MRGTTGAVVALALVLGSAPARALEIEGVRIEERANLGAGAPPLVLNGAGVRHRLAMVKVYVGALYLQAKQGSAEAVLKDPGAKRVAMHILAEEVSAKELIASLNGALANNHIPAELALIESRLRELNRVMSGIGVLKKGAVVCLDYLPGTGTRVTVDGQQKIVIPGEDFYQALLRVWIGKKPVDGRLRDAMLGGGGGFRLF
jgi:hypothetical protein